MKMIATKISTENKPSFIERAVRIIAGAALIGSVFVVGEYPLGWLALLPLLGIYPLYSGLTGAASLHSVLADQLAAYRLAYFTASAALIGSVFVISAAPLGDFAALPLIGAYVALCALLGRSPLAAMVDANMAIPYIVPPTTEAITEPETTQTAIQRAA